MRLDSVRGLKAELFEQFRMPRGNPVDARFREAEPTSVRRGRTTTELRRREQSFLPPLQRSFALGVAPSGKKDDFRLAVRIQLGEADAGALLDRITTRAAHEVDVRFVERVAAGTVPLDGRDQEEPGNSNAWYRLRTRPLQCGLSVGNVDITVGTLGKLCTGRNNSASEGVIEV